jgi:hypothetical protein
MYKKAMKEKEKGIRRKTRINIIDHSLGGALPRFLSVSGQIFVKWFII